jgi:hypothetical protein
MTFTIHIPTVLLFCSVAAVLAVKFILSGGKHRG